MWSNEYYYLNIYKDESLSINYSTTKLVVFINSLPELQQSSGFEFLNVNSFPFIRINLLKVKNLSSWSDGDTDNEKTNLIAIVCEKSSEASFNQIKEILIKIAADVDWPLINEQNDDGEEEIIWASGD